MISSRPLFSARLSSYALDMALTYFLSFLLSPDFDILYQTGNKLLFSFDLVLLQFSLARCLGLLFLTQILRFYCVLFFGHTLFAPLFGMYPREGFVWSRVGGGLRLVLDTLVFPAIILQLLFLNKGLCLSEQVSKTQLVQKSSGVLVWVGHFSAPILVFLSLYSPLFMKLIIFDGVKVIEESVEAPALNATENFDKIKLYKSEKFKIETLSHLGSGRFIIVPDYDFRRSSGQLRVSPYVKIIDRAQNRVGQFKIGPDLRWTPLLSRSQEGMPLWKTQFKNLSLEMTQLSQEALRGDVSHTFSAAACEDFQRLLKASFELGAGSLIDHTIQFGPFIRGMVQLRTALFDVLDSTVAAQVDLVKLGETPFLRFRQFFEFSQESYTSKHTLFPLCTTRAPYYELNFKNDLASLKSRRDFVNIFLSQARWEFDQILADPLPETKSDFHFFHLVDGLTTSNINQAQRQKFEEGSLDFLYRLARLSLQDPLLQEELLHTLAKMEEILELLEKKKEQSFSDDYLLQIIRSKEALEKRDADYFAIETGNEK